jgi:hypothetical protein
MTFKLKNTLAYFSIADSKKDKDFIDLAIGYKDSVFNIF